MRSLRLTAGVRTAALLGLAATPAIAQQSLPIKRAPQPTVAAITPNDLMSRLYVFSDDSMMGREVGTEWHLKATSYIEREIRRMGLQPGGDNGTYFQNLPVFNETISSTPAITVDGKSFSAPKDFLPRDNGVFGKVKSFDGVPVVYGGIIGDSATMISQREAAGKFIVISFPPGPDGKPTFGQFRQQLTGYYLQSAGIAVAGLEAIPQSDREPMYAPTQIFRGGDDGGALQVPAFMYVTMPMAEALVGAPLSSLKRAAQGRTIQGAVKWDSTQAPARNVIGIIPGSDPRLKGEYVAIGAHNDHIGFNHSPVDHDSLRAFNTIVRPEGADDEDRPATASEMAKIRQILDSLRRVNTPRQDSIYNGADDDGSGSVAALEIAEAFMSAPVKPRRSLIFVWHAGEEKGLWGSEYFTDHPTVPRDSIVAQLNMDMIGGGPGYLQLIGSRRLSTELGDIVEQVGKAQPIPFRFDYSYDANNHPQQYYCRSDHYEYARYGIPITFFSTGGHRDYHQVTDEAQYIDYAQLARNAVLVHDVADKVANLDHRIVVDKPKPDPHGQCKQ
jgi:hypothetical protein